MHRNSSFSCEGRVIVLDHAVLSIINTADSP